ncbi:hypothetical protein H0H92_009208, partial [Tricholoma furcatifolium]
KARGGSADIYQGRTQEKIVGVKTIRRSKDTLDKVSKNVLNEVILCGYLPGHPNILPLLGIHRERDIKSLVYPWVEHGDLVSYLTRYPDSNRIQLLHDVSMGLRFLHERFIVHGDLKGINVLVNDSGSACIADFGLSSILPSRGGTLYCQAPELFQGEYNTKATDMYAFGCLIYEVRVQLDLLEQCFKRPVSQVFAGEQPFAGIFNPSLIASKVLEGHRPKRPDNSPSWNPGGLTDDLWAMIEGCWKADPVERPTIDAVIQSLERALRKRELDDGLTQLAMGDKPIDA